MKNRYFTRKFVIFSKFKLKMLLKNICGIIITLNVYV